MKSTVMVKLVLEAVVLSRFPSNLLKLETNSFVTSTPAVAKFSPKLPNQSPAAVILRPWNCKSTMLNGKNASTAIKPLVVSSSTTVIWRFIRAKSPIRSEIQTVARSLLNKLAEFYFLLRSGSYGFIAVVETWLNDKIDDVLLTSEFDFQV